MRKEVVGTCGLCRTSNAILLDSHVIPAWAYRRVRADDQRNPNPVELRDARASTTSRQVTRHFLCKDCEAEFGKREHYVALLARKSEQDFPLEREVKAKGGLDPACILSVVVDSLRSAEVTYFALSLLWRADVMVGWISLGPYCEPIQEFLLGRSPFPKNVHVTMLVLGRHDDAVDLDRVFTSAVTRRSGACRVHMFSLCGMEFLTWIGAEMPTDICELCLDCSAKPTVLYSTSAFSPSSQALLSAVGEAVRTR